MTKMLDIALDHVRRLAPDEQDEIARAMLSLAGADDPSEEIDPDHIEDVLEGLRQARRGEYASEAEVAKAFAKILR